MIVLELILFCALFTLMVKIAVGNNALNGLYFYPKPVQERAFELGLTDRETVARKRTRFMIPFLLVLLMALVLIIGGWNETKSLRPAYLQALLFLEVMGYSKFWLLPGCEDIPYVQTWKEVLKKRGILTLIWIIGAAVVAGIVVFVF